jgi:hypothetical protein
MLAGAVALAAGHLQPLVRLEPYAGGVDSPGSRGGFRRFRDVLTQAEAWDLAQRIENHVAGRVARYRQLGDDCDFLTLAGDWPYRYTCDFGPGPASGIYAVDDLIGRRLEGDPDDSGLSRSRWRWSYVGRLIGGPAASVARAMAALFLQPSSALLWDTYPGGEHYAGYNMEPAAELLFRALPGRGAVVHRSGPGADLTSWHRAVDPVNRSGLVLINSSGMPDYFTISGGTGRPGDLPPGVPTAVAMIHSFSAADPTDAQTIGGRWLSQGAFVYFGSVNEPFLAAFRTPRLVAAVLAAGVPLVAALRQAEFELFGFPWRLVYLGDPLYRLQAAAPAQVRPMLSGAVASRPNDAAENQPRASWLGTWWNSATQLQHPMNDRLPPSQWQAIAPAYADWPVLAISPPVTGPIPSSEHDEATAQAVRLRWCLDWAIADLTTRARGGPLVVGSGSGESARSPNVPPRDWRSVLRQLRRDQLDHGVRPVYDDLLIDALQESGDFEELQTRLARLPPQESSLRVWMALETCAMGQLARLNQQNDPIRGFTRALDLWDNVMRLSWPAASAFPAQFTERVAALALADPRRRLGAWLGRLRRTVQEMTAQPGRFPHAEVVAVELARLEARLGLHRSIMGGSR